MAAGLAVANLASSSSTVDTQWNGSGSVLCNGFSLTVAAGTQDLKSSSSTDPVFYYGKMGYQASLVDAGQTAFSVELGRVDDLAANGDEAIVYGISVTQGLDDWGTELYAGFRIYDLDRPGTSTDNIAASMVGAIVTF